MKDIIRAAAVAFLFALCASWVVRGQDFRPSQAPMNMGSQAQSFDASTYRNIFTRQFKWVDGLVTVIEPAAIDFIWMGQTNNPFPAGMVPGIPILPSEFHKAGILIAIKNCEGCAKYTVRVTYERTHEPPAELVAKEEVEAVPGVYSNAVVWLGKTPEDHKILKVAVEALAVVAKAEQVPK